MHATQVFGECLPRHCHRIAMQQPSIEKPLHQRCETADLDQFRHHVFAARFQVGNHRRSAADPREIIEDRKSTRLNSSHSQISYAVFCLKKKKFCSCVCSNLPSTSTLLTTRP